MKKIIVTIGIAILTATSIFAQNVFVSNDSTHPIPTTAGKMTIAGSALTYTTSQSHITTKTTTTVTSSTAYITAVAICVTGAGTTQTLVIQDKSGTPLTFYTAGTAIAVGNTYINVMPQKMNGGIDIVTGGTTAGTQDVFIGYLQ